MGGTAFSPTAASVIATKLSAQSKACSLIF
jgi:hypothetical protein